MRSSSKAALAAALALGSCGGGWWHDQPAAAPPAATVPAGGATYGGESGYPQAGPAVDGQYPAPQYPAGAEPVYPSGQDYAQGAPYQSPQPKPERQPRRKAEPIPAVDTGYTPPVQNTVKYDNVGIAAWSAEPGTVAGAHPTLPPGSFVEVTALDTGKTILVPITAQSRPGREIELSGAAAQELGLGMGGGQAGVRVRTTNPTGADIGALKAGRPAPPRPDTPPVLLNALRRKLSGTQGQVGEPYQPPPQSMPAPVRQMQPAARPVPRPPATRPAPLPAQQAGGAGYYVQVAAIADVQRATAIAREVGGSISSVNGLARVRFGPFDDLATAQAARDDVARRGYGDARIVRQD